MVSYFCQCFQIYCFIYFEIQIASGGQQETLQAVPYVLLT